MQAIILGTVIGVGGGTLRDVLIRQIPTVLSSRPYAIPALVAATLVLVATSGGLHQVLGAPVAAGAAGVCFAIRMAGLRFRLAAPSLPAREPPVPTPPLRTTTSRGVGGRAG